jgi:D-aspartate ligase
MTPALVLGEGVTALGAIRNLGRKGIPQFAVGTAGSVVAHSRWYRPLPGSSRDVPTPSALREFLFGLPFDRMVLIPCSDAWATAVAGLPPEFAERFPASLVPRETLACVLDKAQFAATLARLGLSHPRTVCIGPEDDGGMLPDEAFQGAFLKPCDSQAFRSRYGVKGLWFKTRAEAVALVREARQAHLELMLQEYISGPPSRYYMVEGFVDRTGRVCARFARQRLQMYPTDFGNSTYMVSVPLEAVQGAVRTLDRLLEALQYRGVFAAEFKHDERDGCDKLLEVNPRPWAQVGFAAACGVDVCEMAYRDALGLTVEPVLNYEVGRRCVEPRFCWELVRKGRLTPWAWGRSLVGATQLILCGDDPAPMVATVLDGPRRVVGGLLRKLGLRRNRR